MGMRQNRLDDALRDAGAVLVRTNKHRIYRLPNGRTYVRSGSSSDHRAEMNGLRDLARLLRDTTDDARI